MCDCLITPYITFSPHSARFFSIGVFINPFPGFHTVLAKGFVSLHERLILYTYQALHVILLAVLCMRLGATWSSCLYLSQVQRMTAMASCHSVLGKQPSSMGRVISIALLIHFGSNLSYGASQCMPLSDLNSDFLDEESSLTLELRDFTVCVLLAFDPLGRFSFAHRKRLSQSLIGRQYCTS
jgi:hypothetical protein